MKKLKKILIVFVALLVTLSLASCKQNPKANFIVPEGGYDGSEVTIRFSHTMGKNLTDVLDEYIEEFNKIYPNITIEHSQVGNYDDVRNQVITELSAGDEPNIAYCYPDHVALYNVAGAVAQLDDLIASEESDGKGGIIGLTQEQKDAFIQGYYDEGRQFGDDFMYLLPFSKSTEVLYYNKTYFTEKNIKVPTHWFKTSETDDTAMEYVCAQIIADDPTATPLGYDSEANWFITMCEQYGSGYTSMDEDNHFIFNNATNKDFCAKFADWCSKGYLTTSELCGSYTSSLFVNTTGEGSHSYMSIGSTAGATHQRPTADDSGNYPFEVGIATIPQINPESPKVISQGPDVCIFKKDDPMEVVASWLFVKFLTTSIDFQADFSIASGYMPVISTVTEDTTYNNWLNKADGGSYIAALSAKVALQQKDAYFVSPAFNGSSKARDEVGSLLQKVLVNPGEIEQAFSSAIEECEFFIS